MGNPGTHIRFGGFERAPESKGAMGRMTVKIGTVELQKTAALAPLAGVADRAFRELCRGLGACYTVGEMTSSKGLTYQNKKTADLLKLGEEEHPGGIQLFGDDPLTMARAAELSMAYCPDIIDINMGCPAPKVAGNGGGSALMKDPAKASRIIQEVVRAVPVPVTVKFRKGWDERSVNAVEFAKMAEQSGAAALTIHGRTRQQMYAPSADWQIIKAVKDAVKIPVIGNGDVDSVESAVRMYEQTGVDLVMIGRGALGNPYLFTQIQRYFADGVLLPDPPLSQRLDYLLEQTRRAVLYKGEPVALKEARKHAAWYLKGVHGAARLRGRTGALKTLRDLEKLVEDALLAAADV